MRRPRASSRRCRDAAIALSRRQRWSRHAIRLRKRLPGTLSRRRLPSATPSSGAKLNGSALHAALADARSGRGRLALISGEPGIGKSRLCAELATDAESNGIAVLIGHCSEQEAVPYLPFVEILESFVDRIGDPDDLRRAVGEEGPELGRVLPRLKRVLPDLRPPMELESRQARWHLFNCFSNFFARIGRQQPTLMILEDLHWADDSTLELLAHFSRRLSDLPLMLVGTYRHEVGARSNLSLTLEDLVRGRIATQIKLKGFPPEEVALMLRGLSGKPPPPNVVAKIHCETEGNPFFVEELFRYLVQEDRLFDLAGQFRTHLEIGELDVPDNVRLVVGRRLSRLSDAARQTLATAAVIGRFFVFPLLEAATHAAPESLLDSLDEAESIRLIRSSAERDDARSEFSHELVRQVVLSQLSGARAARLHLEVAEAIEKKYAGTLEDHYGELAHHYTRTGNARKAATYLHLASKQAADRGSYTEAVEHFEAGLEQLKKLVDDDLRAEMELDLRIGVQPALAATNGQGSSETLQSAERALALSRRPGVNWRKIFSALTGLFTVQLFRDVPKLCELAAELVALAEANQGAEYRAFALFCLAWARVESADFEGAAEALDKERALLESTPNPATDRAHLVRISENLGLSSFNQLCLGYPDRASELLHTATSLAKASGSKATLRVRYSGAVFLHQLRGDLVQLKASAEANLALTTELGDLTHIGQSEILLGWTQAMTGDLAGGIERMRRHVGEYRAAGAEWAAEYFLALMAIVLARSGQHDEALRIIGDSLSIIEKTGERFFEAEVHRIKGELLFAQDPSNAAPAESSFRTAIEISRRQRGKSFELRATLSLAGLLRDTGRREEARAMLAEIYNWFTEGFDTADLKDAKALLDELGSNGGEH
jgi:tetratricopeptide (TPR) repeat protein